MRYSSLAGDQQGLLLNHRSNLGGRVLVAFVVSNWNALLLKESWVGFSYAHVLSSPLNQSQSEDKSKFYPGFGLFKLNYDLMKDESDSSHDYFSSSTCMPLLRATL